MYVVGIARGETDQILIRSSETVNTTEPMQEQQNIALFKPRHISVYGMTLLMWRVCFPGNQVNKQQSR